MSHLEFNMSLLQIQTTATPDVVTSEVSSLIGWIIALSLAAVVVTLVVRPLILAKASLPQEKTNPIRAQLDSLQDNLRTERQVLQELEFDRELGIMDDADYTSLKENSADKLQVLSTTISSLERQLSVVKPTPIAKKTLVKEKLKCGECGSVYKAGQRFCAKCNAPLPILCTKCGKEASEDDRFCSKCGAAVNT